jgi:hypothetical protein
MVAYAAARRCAGPPDQSNIASRELSPGTCLARLWQGARGVGGNGAVGDRKSLRHHALCWEAMMSHEGEINRFLEDGFPAPHSPLPSPGCLQWQRGSGANGGGYPNNVPRARRGAKALANAVAFFTMINALVRWRGGWCVKNGGGNVLALTARKSRQWTAKREREGGGGGRSDEAVAMLLLGGRATDNTTRGGGGRAERVVRGVLEERGGADDARQAGGG